MLAKINFQAFSQESSSRVLPLDRRGALFFSDPKVDPHSQSYRPHDCDEVESVIQLVIEYIDCIDCIDCQDG